MSPKASLAIKVYGSRPGFAKKTVYIGAVCHNANLTKDEFVMRVAERTHRPASDISYCIDMLGEQLVEEIAQGNHVNLGWCEASLQVTGNFEASNSPIGENNALVVRLTPGKLLANATRSLAPYNRGREEKPFIYTVQQLDGMTATGYRYNESEISAEGPRTLGINTQYCNARPGVEDEGVWIEDMEGVRLATCTIRSSDMAHLEVTLEDTLPVGSCRLAIAARGRDSEGDVTIVRRNLRVVSSK